MKTPAATLLKPYKFLEHYDFGDREIFFGRERESEILLSDVIATRLVVLFARTGSGKSSLINAGVRPRLEDLDYATFYVRVEKDPIASMRKTLEESLLPDPGEDLEAMLLQTVEKLQRPTVVFFDQFEEFFIYAMEDQPALARRFIAHVARLYRNRDSGVHLVFSMREEFFVEMDVFRDEIPSIFHSDSNLRLRWFGTEQARDAIVLPARRFDTHVEESLVDRLVQDLQQGGRVEPARLQIVCDTLWQHRSNSSMLLADYERLGGSERILDRRLMQDITTSFDDEMLEQLGRLLPELITERGTKYVRGFDELAKNLGWDPSLLQKLVEQLSTLGLVRISTYSGARFFEWTSDYLAERTRKIQERVRTVLLTRRLQAAIDRARKLAELPGQNKTLQLTYEQRDVLYLSDQAFDTLSESAGAVAELDREQLEFLFVAALEHGDHMRLWFDRAADRGVPVWDILKDRIGDETRRLEQAGNAVRLLGELKNDQALELLEAALQIGTLSSLAIKVLGRMETPAAIQLLEKTLHQQETLAPEVLAVLAQSGNPQAVAVLQAALQQENLAQQAELGLDKISRSRSVESAQYAGEVLEKWKAGRHAPLPVQPKEARDFLEKDWALLLRRIQAGKCTPILGPQLLAGLLPSQDMIARKWADEVGYPRGAGDGLPRVAQYMGVIYDSLYPKEKLVNEIKSMGDLEVAAADDPHRILAGLPLSMYISANYDRLMAHELRRAQKRPFEDRVRWNRYQQERPPAQGDREPTPAEPLVYHVYGTLEQPESLVLTEDDYLAFLAAIESEPNLIPHQVRRGLAATSLLLIGFDFTDYSYRILLRSLVTSAEQSLRRISIACHMLPDNADGNADKLQMYIENSYEALGARVFWGSPREFVRELSRRWSEYSDAR